MLHDPVVVEDGCDIHCACLESSTVRSRLGEQFIKTTTYWLPELVFGHGPCMTMAINTGGPLAGKSFMFRVAIFFSSLRAHLHQSETIV